MSSEMIRLMNINIVKVHKQTQWSLTWHGFYFPHGETHFDCLTRSESSRSQHDRWSEGIRIIIPDHLCSRNQSRSGFISFISPAWVSERSLAFVQSLCFVCLCQCLAWAAWSVVFHPSVSGVFRKSVFVIREWPVFILSPWWSVRSVSAPEKLLKVKSSVGEIVSDAWGGDKHPQRLTEVIQGIIPNSVFSRHRMMSSSPAGVLMLGL